MHRLMRIASVALITAGLVVLADVGVTLAWKEPLSAVYGELRQGEVEGSLGELEDRFPAPADLRGTGSGDNPKRRVRRLAERFAREVGAGDGIGRIAIPSIGLDTVMVEGTDTDSLRSGPGRYPETAFPGQGRTVGVAGHRTTYLAPFRHVDEIADGDRIVLEMPYATLVYRVQRHRVVAPSQVEIVRDVGYDRLVLTACHPLYSAARRWAVFARLDELSPFAAGASAQDP